MTKFYNCLYSKYFSALEYIVTIKMINNNIVIILRKYFHVLAVIVCTYKCQVNENFNIPYIE